MTRMRQLGSGSGIAILVVVTLATKTGCGGRSSELDVSPTADAALDVFGGLDAGAGCPANGIRIVRSDLAELHGSAPSAIAAMDVDDANVYVVTYGYTQYGGGSSGVRLDANSETHVMDRNDGSVVLGADVGTVGSALALSLVPGSRERYELRLLSSSTSGGHGPSSSFTRTSLFLTAGDAAPKRWDLDGTEPCSGTNLYPTPAGLAFATNDVPDEAAADAGIASRGSVMVLATNGTLAKVFTAESAFESCVLAGDALFYIPSRKAGESATLRRHSLSDASDIEIETATWQQWTPLAANEAVVAAIKVEPDGSLTLLAFDSRSGARKASVPQAPAGPNGLSIVSVVGEHIYGSGDPSKIERVSLDGSGRTTFDLSQFRSTSEALGPSKTAGDARGAYVVAGRTLVELCRP